MDARKPNRSARCYGIHDVTNLFVFNMVPLLPLDGGHIAGALYEGLRRQVARIRGKKVLPGPADTAKLLPVAYVVSMFLVIMSVVIIAADIFNPLNFD